jgi:hypothetical protein
MWKKIIFFAILFLLFSALCALGGDEKIKKHDWNIDPHLAPLGLSAVHDSTAGEWNFAFVPKVMFFRPRKHILVGGIGGGVIFAKRNKGTPESYTEYYPVVTVIPVQIGYPSGFSVEFTPYRFTRGQFDNSADRLLLISLNLFW